MAAFCSTTYNAANFGFANRLFLGLMLQRAVTDKVRPYEMKLLYDSPTTLSGKEEMEGRNYFIHRKGPAQPGGWRDGGNALCLLRGAGDDTWFHGKLQLSAERHGKSAIPVERQPWSQAQAFQERRYMEMTGI